MPRGAVFISARSHRHIAAALALTFCGVFATPALAGYELIAGGLRRGSVVASVSQSGQTSSASPTIDAPNLLLPDATWTGALVTLGGSGVWTNVAAGGEGRYWLATTPSSLFLRTRTSASRSLTGGINPAATATAATQCAVPFRVDATQSLSIRLKIARSGLDSAPSFVVRVQVLPSGAVIFERASVGEESTTVSLEPGEYRIWAGATATPPMNATSLVEVEAEINGFASACPADFNGDGFLDFTDFDDFVVAFEAGAASADFNADGFLDFTDFDAFVEGFEGGC